MTTISQTYDLFHHQLLVLQTCLPSSPPDIYSYPFQSNEIVEHPAYLSMVPQYDYLGDGPILGPNDENNRTLFAGALSDRVNTELGEFVYNTPKIDPSQYPNIHNSK